MPIECQQVFIYGTTAGQDAILGHLNDFNITISQT